MDDSPHDPAKNVNLELLSLDLEVETGYDSIPTIEDIYDCACPWPDCNYRHTNPEKMWKHVHFGKHGFSFGASFPDLIDARRGTIGMHL